MSNSLPRPTAETKSVVELVEHIVEGRVRIPFYQRDLKWESEDVIKLFDSIYRGFPIGSLLLHSRPLPAKVLELGPLQIQAAEQSMGFDVVDGQQRLVALSASLARPMPIPTTLEDPYVVYFDAEHEVFRAPSKGAEVPAAWVPLPVMLDGSRLTEWVFNWEYSRDAGLRRRVFEAGARIREFKIPLYSVAIAEGDTDVLRELFERVNTAGKRLTWIEIHDSLYGAPTGAKPSTVPELMEALAELGIGVPQEEKILSCLIAFEGKDVTQSYQVLEHKHPRFLKNTATRALPILRRVFDFVREDAGIVHMRLLPRGAPLVILTRFFRFHAEPRARTRLLLTWWLWRAFLAIPQLVERTFLRRGGVAIDGDEEGSMQRLLGLVPNVAHERISLAEHFDARSADSRLALLSLASLVPRDLGTGRPVAIAELIGNEGRGAFRRIVTGTDPLGGSPENRCILPGRGRADREFIELSSGLFSKGGQSAELLESHGISPKAYERLVAGDREGFLRERRQRIESVLRALIKRLSGGQQSTRPSINYLSRMEGE